MFAAVIRSYRVHLSGHLISRSYFGAVHISQLRRLNGEGKPIVYSFDGKQPEWHAYPRIEVVSEFTIDEDKNPFGTSKAGRLMSVDKDRFQVRDHLDCVSIYATALAGKHKGKRIAFEVPMEKSGNMPGLNVVTQ